MSSEPLAATCWSEELRATHLALSAADLKFRELALQSPALLRRSTFRAFDAASRIFDPKQPWPTFIGGDKLARLKRLSLEVAALIRSLPRRVFANHPARICEYYDLPSQDAVAIMLAEPSGIAESMGRGDVIDTADGFKCIEFNFGARLGGWEHGLLAELQEKIPETAGFLEREGIRCSYTPTLRLLFEQMISLARRQRLCERGELNVACALHPDDIDRPMHQESIAILQRELERSCRNAMPPLSGKVVACHYGQLAAAQGRLFHREIQVHAVLELCARHAPPAVYRLFKAGRLLLFNGPIDDVLRDKRNLALLSLHESSNLFSPREQEVIRTYVPWTRLVRAEPVRFGGEEVFLPDLLVSGRERLVLKQAMGHGGSGVFLGRWTGVARWEELVRSSLATGGWVVQEHLESLPYLYQSGEYGCEAHDVVWGPFVFGSTFGGVVLRMQPQAAGGPVNLSLAAREGLVLEV